MRKLKITELNRLTPEAFKDSKKIPLVVVLDHVRSLNNVGSVFRTSDAFRVESIYLCGITLVRLMPRFIRRLWERKKLSIGSILKIRWRLLIN